MFKIFLNINKIYKFLPHKEISLSGFKTLKIWIRSEHILKCFFFYFYVIEFEVKIFFFNEIQCNK